MKIKLAFAILGLLSAILIGCYTSLLLSFVFAFWGVVLFGSISFLTWSWYVGIRRTGGEARSWLLPTAKITGFLVLLSAVLVITTFAAQKRRESVAIYYALRIDPALEAWKLKNGRYPAKLEDVQCLPRAPRFLRQAHSYSISSDGKSWNLCFSDGGFGLWFYDSQTKSWCRD
ncbi:MAG: hypothetical protein RL095_1032 [Verrucomicrobiota bacterium]|jgi:hypothetical protein